MDPDNRAKTAKFAAKATGLKQPGSKRVIAGSMLAVLTGMHRAKRTWRACHPVPGTNKWTVHTVAHRLINAATRPSVPRSVASQLRGAVG